MPGWGGTPYNGLCGEAPPKRGTFFRLQLYERVGKSVIYVFKRALNFEVGNNIVFWLTSLPAKLFSPIVVH